jgi:membrane peptidoglycan carboxypeptidase
VRAGDHRHRRQPLLPTRRRPAGDRARVWQNLSSGGVVSGASTLTQQLARNLFMDADERYQTSYRRKLREAWLAWQLERHYNKDQLLALYLNQTYYGNFAFGLEAARKSSLPSRPTN